MITNINLNKVLFLDIETVPAYSCYEDLPEDFKKLWGKKSRFLQKEEEDTVETLYDRAGIYAEFGKIICISVGYIDGEKFRVKSFTGEENKLLREFAELLNKYYNGPDHLLCAHNGKEFDFPYIARRMLVNEISLPPILDIAGAKPWEVKHLDTMQLWRFGDYKHYTSLELLAYIFKIPTPKDDIDGSQISEVYYQEKDLDRIINYCQKDTVTVARIFLAYMNKPGIKEENIIFI